eukprot:scaffold498_cov291-Prasinococcus_capsulatus_cf.AAC.6
MNGWLAGRRARRCRSPRLERRGAEDGWPGRDYVDPHPLPTGHLKWDGRRGSERTLALLPTAAAPDPLDPFYPGTGCPWRYVRSPRPGAAYRRQDAPASSAASSASASSSSAGAASPEGAHAPGRPTTRLAALGRRRGSRPASRRRGDGRRADDDSPRHRWGRYKGWAHLAA